MSDAKKQEPPWDPDERFWKAVKKCVEEYIEWSLKDYVEDAYQNFSCDVLKRKNTYKRLAEMPTDSDRLKYSYVCIRRKALRYAKEAGRSVLTEIPPGGGATIGDFSHLTLKDVNDSKRLFLLLLYLKYTQKQMSRLLEVSEATISRRKKKLLEACKESFREGHAMSEESQFDRSVYDFIDKDRPPQEAPGNDNLRRAIERIIAPVREIMTSLNEEWRNPPIPSGMRKMIQEMIKDHENPPTIGEILAKAENQQPDISVIWPGLLEAARKLAQPFRWISPEESLRVIRDPHHAGLSIGWLVAVMARGFQAFSNWAPGIKNPPQLTHIICDRLATGPKGTTLIGRFKNRRGSDKVSPIPVLMRQVELSEIAVKMNRATDALFEKHLPKFKEECRRIRDLGDTGATVQDLQLLVNSLNRLLDWGFFNSPRYLAPALMEEAIEAVMAINGPMHEKRHVPDELADLFYMALWLSNVLSVPNPGREIMGSYK